MGIHEVVSAPRSLWQNAHVERPARESTESLKSVDFEKDVFASIGAR